MIDHVTPERWDGTIGGDGPTGPTGAEMVESYDIDGGVVLYDAENPPAWVEASNSMHLDDRA